ncbi:MAG: sulfite reductase subunit alpha, partial [Methylobacteriaceae bacterium]|nr:sulfite reductase subunit alpha [Methylobacteriaceae bacterium]
FIPENAPFSAEQRAWLSGFMAALVSPDVTGATALSADEAGAVLGEGKSAVPLASNDEAPWHDPAMPLDERMELAAEKPLAPKLMAAMAQQDCGQCGYNCADYANAIFLRKEERLNLCVPGGKDTTRMVKKLAEALTEEASVAPTVDAAPAAPAVVDAANFGRSREQPTNAKLLGRRLLNGPGSEKETWHIDFDLSDSGIDYEVGDSFGIFAKNNLGLVDQIIAMLGAAHTTPVRERTLREVLHEEVSLGAAPDSLYELFSYVSGGKVRDKARALARGEDPDGDAAHIDVLGAFQKFQTVRPHPEALIDALEPLQPRLYSISSSHKAAPGRISLTVDAVRYIVGKRKRLGLASTYLAECAAPGDTLKVYVQKAHNFSLPADPNIPIIMVGPGTGVAPFRAFLQERQAIGASGQNWLFFGHQRSACDFFYREELHELRQKNVLTRLSLAWSRDGKEKFYVQDRMREVGAELWQWLARGAHFYVCGDAKRMAKDVEAALVEIAAAHGARSTDEAIAFVASLKKAGRYQADVY